MPEDLSLLGHDAVLLGEKCLHRQSSGPFFLHAATPKMRPLRFFEHCNAYTVTQHHVPEHLNLRQNCCRNLRSHRERLLTKRHSRSLSLHNQINAKIALLIEPFVCPAPEATMVVWKVLSLDHRWQHYRQDFFSPNWYIFHKQPCEIASHSIK